MREAIGPPLRAAALTALIVGLIVLLINPPSLGGLDDLMVLILGAVAIALLAAWLTVAMIGREMPEPEFQRLVHRSETLAAMPPSDHPPSEFDELVMEALDDLPEPVPRAARRTPVVVSTSGHEERAYGQYFGGTIARERYEDRIVIYRDTLERDFGHDRDLLRRRSRARFATSSPITSAGTRPGCAASGCDLQLGLLAQELAEAMHRLGVGPSHECPDHGRGHALVPRRLQPGKLEGDPGAALGQIGECVGTASPPLAAGAEGLLDDEARRIGLDHLDVDILVRPRSTDPGARLRAHTGPGAGEIPLVQHVVGEWLVVGEDVEELVDLPTGVGHVD